VKPATGSATEESAMRWCSTVRRIAIAVLCGLACGCRTQHFVARTVLREDGSVERAVWQEDDTYPEAARRPGVWKATQVVWKLADFDADWVARLPLDRLPFEARTAPNQIHSQGRIRAAYGRFASAADIPAHVEIAHEDLPPGKLQAVHRKRDFSVLVEHEWTETLLDALAGPEQAMAIRKQAVDRAIEVVDAVLTEFLAGKYEHRELIAWMNTKGRAWAYESVELALVHMASRGSYEQRSEAVIRAWLKSARENRLVLTNVFGLPLSPEEMDKRQEAFVVATICKHVKSPDGKPISEATVRAWKDPIEPVIEKVADAKFGGKAKLEKDFVRLVAPLGGHYGMGLRAFDYAITMPGEILETNGRMLGANRVGWKFRDHEAMLFGFEMRVRSVVIDTEAQKAIFGKPVLTAREDVVEFLDLMENRPDVQEALRQAKLKSSAEPIRAVLPASDDRKESVRLRKLLRLDVKGG